MQANPTPAPRGEETPPDSIRDVPHLEELLSRPPGAVADLFARLEGPLAIVGGGGKIGPSLTAMACRARAQAGTRQEIIVIDRFPDAQARRAFEALGARTIACDLLDERAVAGLPQAASVVYMAGMKFGTTGDPSLTWAVNALMPAYVAGHYRRARIVAFSTGCVYPLVAAESSGSVETDGLEPPGEYANSCVARERIMQFCSGRHGTPMVLVRLNYAVEMRYGVLADLACDIAAGRPVDVTMGCFNVMWQGDVNAAVLRLLDHAAVPPLALNLTGAEKVSTRHAALRLGELMHKTPTMVGKEAPTALLSDASKAHALLGRPQVAVETILRWTAEWVAAGKPLLGMPTHFQTRDGKY